MFQFIVPSITNDFKSQYDHFTTEIKSLDLSNKKLDDLKKKTKLRYTIPCIYDNVIDDSKLAQLLSEVTGKKNIEFFLECNPYILESNFLNGLECKVIALTINQYEDLFKKKKITVTKTETKEEPSIPLKTSLTKRDREDIEEECHILGKKRKILSSKEKQLKQKKSKSKPKDEDLDEDYKVGDSDSGTDDDTDNKSSLSLQSSSASTPDSLYSASFYASTLSGKNKQVDNFIIECIRPTENKNQAIRVILDANLIFTLYQHWILQFKVRGKRVEPEVETVEEFLNYFEQLMVSYNKEYPLYFHLKDLKTKQVGFCGFEVYVGNAKYPDNFCNQNATNYSSSVNLRNKHRRGKLSGH